jgi:hypothetical protein
MWWLVMAQCIFAAEVKFTFLSFSDARSLAGVDRWTNGGFIGFLEKIGEFEVRQIAREKK